MGATLIKKGRTSHTGKPPEKPRSSQFNGAKITTEAAADLAWAAWTQGATTPTRDTRDCTPNNGAKGATAPRPA